LEIRKNETSIKIDLQKVISNLKQKPKIGSQFSVTIRRRNSSNDFLKNFLDSDPEFRRCTQNRVGADIEKLLELVLDRVRIRVRQVDLVQDGHDHQIIRKRH